VSQDKLIGELQQWTREVTAARDWAEEERGKWQAVAEAAAAAAAETAQNPSERAEVHESSP
jgi:hypothetical protein